MSVIKSFLSTPFVVKKKVPEIFPLSEQIESEIFL